MLPRIDPEFKNLLPLLTGEEYRQLEENILAEGKCRDPVVVWDGVLIDGHIRFDLCVKHRIQFEIMEMTFPSREDAKVWIIDCHAGRRNLNDAMRIEAALRKEGMLRERAREKQSQAGGDKTDGKTDENLNEKNDGKPSTGAAGALLAKMVKAVNEPVNKLLNEPVNEPGYEPLNVRKIIAEEAGVSERTLYNYLDIKANASPEILEQVMAGEMKIGTAHRTLEKEIIKRMRFIDKIYKGLAMHLPIPGGTEANVEITTQLTALVEQLAILIKVYEEKEPTPSCQTPIK